MSRKVHLSSFLIVSFFVFFVLGDLFSISFFQYADEIFELICLLWLVYSFMNGRHHFFLISLIILFLIGISGNFIYKFEINTIQIFEDFLLVLKWPIVFLSLFDYCSVSPSKNKFKNINKILYFMSCLMSVIIFMDCIYKCINIGGQFYFYNNSYAGISAIYTFIFSFIIMSYKKEFNFFIAFILFINLFSTIMTKSTFALVLYIVYFLFIFSEKKLCHYFRGKSFLILSVLAVFCVVLFFSYTKIVTYFFNSNAPRGIFLTNAFKLANQYFPFGVGMGLYGGVIAANTYSPVYTYLGFENIWVVSRGSNFLIDSFFPQIFGEFGYFGFLFYMSLIVYCYKKISKNHLSYKALFVTFVISGISSNFFNSSVGMAMICSFLSFLFCKDAEFTKKTQSISRSIRHDKQPV